MAVYSERVEMITPGSRLFLLAVTAGLIVLLVRVTDFEKMESFWDIARELIGHLHWVIGAIASTTLAFSNQMVIELTNDKLALRAGAAVKRIPLKEISAAKAFAEIGQEHPQFSFLSFIGWHTSFVSQVVKTGVRLSFFDGKTMDFSCNNPDHLSSMIDELARQAGARDPLKVGDEAASRAVEVLRRILPRGDKE
jgi:hypothetical protein